MSDPAALPRPHKYKAKGERYDDRYFASQAELARYKVLKHRQRQGIITGLRCQPRFAIRHPETGEKACTYVADFEYFQDGKVVVEDVKGRATETYKLKRHLMRVFVPEVQVTEVKVRVRKAGIFWIVDGVPEGVVE